jgi:DNA-binding SARP family transcriptional activator
MLFSLKLFGGVALSGGNEPVAPAVVQRHRLALLALLTAPPPQAMSRDKLMSWLWPERDEEHARGLLNQAVYALRQALGSGAVLSAGDGLRIDPAVITTDVLAFEGAIASGALERAVALYTGPFLDGFFLDEALEFERWVERERGRLAGEYALALERLAEAGEQSGEPDRAAKWWQARAAHDPYDSRVALRLMRTLERAGNRAGALQQARGHVERLRDEVGIEPPAEVLAAIERLRGPVSAPPGSQPAQAGLPAATPPVALPLEPRPATPGVSSSPSTATPRRRWLAAAGVLLAVGAVWVGLRVASRPDEVKVAAPGPATVDEIARAVARELERRARGDTLKGGPQYRTRSIPAYELYLRGSDPALLRSDSAARRGLQYFRRAVALDSTYAAAWAGLARMTLRVGASGNLASTTAARAEAEGAAGRAVALDDSLAEGHAVLGITRAMVYDFAVAERHLRRAIELEPTRARHREWAVNFYLLTDRPAEALEEAERAAALEPLSPSATAELARALMANGRCEEALAKLERLRALDPPLLRVPPIVAQCYGRSGRWADAVAVLRPPAGREDPRTLPLLGYMLARAGKSGEARSIQASLLERWRQGAIGAFDLAYIPVALGEYDQAFTWLSRSIDDGSLGSYVSWRAGFTGLPFDELRRDPRLGALRVRLGLQNR